MVATINITVQFVYILAVIKDNEEAFEGFRQKWAPEKRNGTAKQKSGHQKNSNFSACKAQANQHKIRIAFFEHNHQFDIFSNTKNNGIAPLK